MYRKYRPQTFHDLIGQENIVISLSKAIELNRELEDYKEAYEKCYEEYKSLFRERVELKKRLKDIEDLHSHMVNTLHVLLKEGRIIKSRYLHSYVPYGNFGQLSNEDRLELFGA